MPWDDKVVAEQGRTLDFTEGSARLLSYTEALNEAISLALESFPETFVLGQGVDDPTGMFGVTKGLAEKYGSRRVFDVPLSEEAIMGVCVGAATSGMRPLNFHNRPDFILLAMNQLVTHASKIHFMDCGKSSVPMVVWSAIGRGWGVGAQHSQAIQGMLLGVPGLKIVMPSTPADAKGLFLSAVEDNNPVIIFEHRWMMKTKGPVPEGYYTTPFGKGIYRREGKDLSIVGISHAIDLACQAADRLRGSGITADVIDLRTLKPLDEKIILESIAKTGRLMVVDTAWAKGGMCAEIACIAVEKGFHSLRAPVERIGLPDIPTPAGFALEQFYYPSVENLCEKIKGMISSRPLKVAVG